jgi:hypothetical protein
MKLRGHKSVHHISGNPAVSVTLEAPNRFLNLSHVSTITLVSSQTLPI